MTKTYFLWHSKNAYKMNEILRIPDKNMSEKTQELPIDDLL